MFSQRKNLLKRENRQSSSFLVTCEVLARSQGLRKICIHTECMNLKIAKKYCFLWNNSFSMRQIKKNAHEQKWFKISTSMCIPSLKTIYETCRSPNPLWVPPPPETRQISISIFLFSSLHILMMTKNKFFTFPARLTPPGSRSRSRDMVDINHCLNKKKKWKQESTSKISNSFLRVMGESENFTTLIDIQIWKGVNW